MLCSKKLQRVQNKAARIVLEAPRRSHTSPLLRTLHWLPVQQRIDYKVVLLTFKVRSTSTPSYLRLLIQDREHDRNLRSITSITTPCHQPFTALLSLLTNTLPGPSASEVTTLWRYTNLFIIIIPDNFREFFEQIRDLALSVFEQW